MKRILLTLAAAGAALALAAGGAWAAGNGPEIKGTLQTIYTVPGSRAASSFSVKMARVLFSGAAGPDWSYAVLLDAVRQPALLEAHGGDLNGFIPLRGDPAKLGMVRASSLVAPRMVEPPNNQKVKASFPGGGLRMETWTPWII